MRNQYFAVCSAAIVARLHRAQPSHSYSISVYWLAAARRHSRCHQEWRRDMPCGSVTFVGSDTHCQAIQFSSGHTAAAAVVIMTTLPRAASHANKLSRRRRRKRKIFGVPSNAAACSTRSACTIRDYFANICPPFLRAVRWHPHMKAYGSFSQFLIRNRQASGRRLCISDMAKRLVRERGGCHRHYNIRNKNSSGNKRVRRKELPELKNFGR